MRKATELKQTITIVEINEKVMVKEGRLKRYRDRIKQYKKKTRHSKITKKILPPSRGRMHDDIPTTRSKGSKTILEQNIRTMRT